MGRTKISKGETPKAAKKEAEKFGVDIEIVEIGVFDKRNAIKATCRGEAAMGSGNGDANHAVHIVRLAAERAGNLYYEDGEMRAATTPEERARKTF